MLSSWVMMLEYSVFICLKVPFWTMSSAVLLGERDHNQPYKKPYSFLLLPPAPPFCLPKMSSSDILSLANQWISWDKVLLFSPPFPLVFSYVTLVFLHVF